jgi:radical SAM protein with 4Fe4S-binding SPASM domain
MLKSRTSSTPGGAGSNIISASATGDVFPCPALHFPELCAGNVRERSLEDIGCNNPAAPLTRNFADSLYALPGLKRGKR